MSHDASLFPFKCLFHACELSQQLHFSFNKVCLCMFFIQQPHLFTPSDQFIHCLFINFVIIDSSYGKMTSADFLLPCFCGMFPSVHIQSSPAAPDQSAKNKRYFLILGRSLPLLWYIPAGLSPLCAEHSPYTAFPAYSLYNPGD